jgi:hypothetical protein
MDAGWGASKAEVDDFDFLSHGAPLARGLRLQLPVKRVGGI